MTAKTKRTTLFGRFLSDARGSAGFRSGYALAKAAGVAQSTVSDLGLGKRRLTGKMARRLAGPLGLMPNDLLVRANVTPEFDWRDALPSPPSGLRRVQFMVNEDEERELHAYLAAMRARAWLERQGVREVAADRP